MVCLIFGNTNSIHHVKLSCWCSSPEQLIQDVLSFIVTSSADESVCERTGLFLEIKLQLLCCTAKHIHLSDMKTKYIQELFYHLSEEHHQNLSGFFERKHSSSGKMPVKLFHISNSTKAYSLSSTTIWLRFGRS